MTSAPGRPIYLLTVQPLRGVDPTKVLRAALKVLLRRFGLRCLSVQERPHEHPDDEVAS